MTTLWEISFECGNKVGGIWTVITTKSPFIEDVFDEYYAVGIYNPNKREVLFEKPPKRFVTILKRLEKKGIKVYFGTWVETGTKIFLVDSREFTNKNINRIKAEFWEKYKIDSLHAGFDYDEPLGWSYAVGEFLKEIENKREKHLVQLHEWLSAGTLLNLKGHPNFKFVFTTHATVIGRATGGKITGNPDDLASNENVVAKHLTEKTAALLSDVFTTVSKLTAQECERVLGRTPDIITPNGLNFSKIPQLSQLLSDKVIFRRNLLEFVRAYFLPYYSLDTSDYPVVYTSGRYEFFNKGYDEFIRVLGGVNDRLKQENSSRWGLAFILVPTGTVGVKEEVIQNFMFYKRLKEIAREDLDTIISKVYEGEDVFENLQNIAMDLEGLKLKIRTRRGSRPPLCAFELSYPEEEDAILNALKSNGLLNRKEDRIKVVYYPVYINRTDELLGMTYTNFLTAASMGVFLSRYEPWGYTPLEAAAYLGTSITTNKTGFGQVVSQKRSSGIKVVSETPIEQVFDFVNKPKDERLSLEMHAYKFVKENFSWKLLIKNYLRAYELALNQ